MIWAASFICSGVAVEKAMRKKPSPASVRASSSALGGEGGNSDALNMVPGATRTLCSARSVQSSVSRSEVARRWNDGCSAKWTRSQTAGAAGESQKMGRGDDAVLLKLERLW